MRFIVVIVCAALLGGAAAFLAVVATSSEEGEAPPALPAPETTVEVLSYETRSSDRPTREREAPPPEAVVPEPTPDDPPVEPAVARAAVEAAFHRLRETRPGLPAEICWQAEDRMDGLHAALDLSADQVDRVAVHLLRSEERRIGIRRRIVSLSAEAEERYRGWFRDGLRHASCPSGDIRPVLERIDPELARLAAARDDLDRDLIAALAAVLTDSQTARLSNLARNPE